MINPKETLTALYDEVLEWCHGRIWYARLPFLLYFAYVLVRHLHDPIYNSVLGGLNLGIHELGHVVFSPFGQFLQIAGGTFLQCLIPIAGMINFYVQKDFFSITLCFGWLSTNFFHIATYISDTYDKALPYVAIGGAGEAVHDWEYLLSEFGLLGSYQQVAWCMRAIAVMLMLVCLGSGLWLSWQMKKYKAA
jgi:hypothetical protein